MLIYCVGLIKQKNNFIVFLPSTPFLEVDSHCPGKLQSCVSYSFDIFIVYISCITITSNFICCQKPGNGHFELEILSWTVEKFSLSRKRLCITKKTKYVFTISIK